MNVCTYYFDSSVGKYKNPVLGDYCVSRLIPFNNKTKKGWCEFHGMWEVVTVGADSRFYFSCGRLVPGSLGFDKCWNKNNFSFFVDRQNLILTLTERNSWIDVHEGGIYQTNDSKTKIFDMRYGKIYSLKNHRLKEIPLELSSNLEKVFANFSKSFFGVELKLGKDSLEEFLKYPSCPKFNRIAGKIDQIEKFQFRNDVNLFKDFCELMHIRESKSLRKDFQKLPESIFFHAMAQSLNFRDPNAIRLLVFNKEILKKFIGKMRFSIIRRSVYVNDTFYTVREHGKYKLNMLDGLRLWVQNALTDKSEIVVMKRLIHFLNETPFDVVKDACEIYDTNARNLPVAFHERILREGLTSQMHDQLVIYFGGGIDDFAGGGYTSNERHVSNTPIEYDDDIMRFEDTVFYEDVDVFLKSMKSSKADIAKNRLMMKKAAENNDAARNMANMILNEANDGKTIDDEFTDDEEKHAGENVPDLDQKFETQEIDSKFEIGKELRKRASLEELNSRIYFVLPRTTDELYEISANMRNCVGYLYRDKVLTHKSIIVVAIYKNKFIACMEIKQNERTFAYEVVQASGVANRNIKMRYKGAIEKWKDMKKIGGKIFYS